jgi:hypothetical protein
VKQAYITRRFSAENDTMLDVIDNITQLYLRRGYVMTVRQLYYQLVTRNLIRNHVKSYNRIKSLVNDGRLAGRIDWSVIEDRMRSFERRKRWKNARTLLEHTAQSYHIDLWRGQDLRPFIFIEKDSLAGVISATCAKYDMPMLAARGYPSVSVLREFVLRDLLPTITKRRQGVVILHLGDHDPSGLDMTRDLVDRMSLLSGIGQKAWRVVRLCLNIDQVRELNLPPNPAKDTDARFAAYRAQFGRSSWELDALEPDYMNDLIKRHARNCITNKAAWVERHATIKTTKARLLKIASNWNNGADNAEQ